MLLLIDVALRGVCIAPEDRDCSLWRLANRYFCIRTVFFSGSIYLYVGPICGQLIYEERSSSNAMHRFSQHIFLHTIEGRYATCS